MTRAASLTCALAAWALLSPAPARSAAATVAADWVQKPSGEQFADAYPPLANSLQIEGRVMLACAMTINGVLAECVTESETPKGLGFGDAALSMTPYFRMRPTTVDGRPEGDDNLRIPISFKLPSPPPPFNPGAPTSTRALEIARLLVAAEDISGRLSARYGPNAPDKAQWTRRGAPAATVAAAGAAQQAALATGAPALREAMARGYAALFSADELAANLAFVTSPAGRTASRKTLAFEVLGGPLSWVTFRHGLSRGREIFCEAHDCVRRTSLSGVGPPPTMLTPDWLEQPTRRQILEGMPFLAAALGIPGQADLRCDVNAIGMLEGCVVLRANPSGLGFGAAAVGLANLYRAQPLPPGATATAPTVELRISFPEPPVRPPPFEPQPILDADPGETRLVLGQQIIAATDLRSDVLRFNLKSMDEFDAIPAPGADAKTRAAARAALKAGLDEAADLFLTERTKHYAGLFSEAELRALLAWRLSPAGKVFRAKQDQLNELGTAMDKVFDFETSRQAGLIFCASRGCVANVAAGRPPP